MTATAAPRDCAIVSDFSVPGEARLWGAVNDGVMGGRSSGGSYFTGESMVFSGVINTNGGGFSSVRRGLEPGTLAGKDGLLIRVKTDGRAYRLTVRTAERFRGRSVAYTADIEVRKDADWVEAYVPFDAFSASVFGQSVPAPPLNPETAWSVGFILGDGQDGPFKMEAEWIKVCEDIARTV